MPRTVIVGASVGGMRTAQALCGAGYSGEVVVIGDEHHAPYDRPPLSKSILAGTAKIEDIPLVAATAPANTGIAVRLGRRALSADLAARELELDGGERCAYDALVIATGASARPSPWGTRPGIHVLRTFLDAQALREDMLGGGHVVIVGGGFIGCEVAASARGLGLDVSIVDPLPAPMVRVLGAEVGETFTELHRRHGVDMYLGYGVEAIDGERGAMRVALTSGETLEADLVVVGIGSVPNDAWLSGSGLEIDNGVVCDEHGCASGAPEVFAVGDVARWRSPGRRAAHRAEHWTNAVEQASVVAHNIVHPGQLRAHESSGYVWSDQYDWKIQVAGETNAPVVEQIGAQSAGRFAVLYGTDTDDLCGVMTVNWPRALVQGRRALMSRTSRSDLRNQLMTPAVR